MVCSIICGAPCGALLKEHVEGYVIAADRGLDYCLAAGITPDLAVGDFDSAYSVFPEGVECIRVSPIKDDTDAALAADLAVQRGYRDIRFFCALGGRLDHTLGNIQLLYHLKKNGICGRLISEDTEVFFLIGESAVIPKNDGFLSVFSYEGSVRISISGVKYPLDKHVITNDVTLGVSNEIIEDRAVITVHEGAALIVLSKRDR
ncbi:MAG: thiamine diphosphokinase [Oscillospiraceae bacterium]|nr:thiamine diphosphokinase [Oscillospiraceae bacterium]